MVAPASPIESFIWGAGGARKTPEQIAREREIAASLLQQGMDFSPIASPWQGAARVANAAAGAFKNWRADQATQANAETNQSLVQNLLGGGEFPPAPTPAGGDASATGDVSQSSIGPLGDSQESFVSSLAPAALEASKRTGVDPRIIIAQAAQETGWGKHAPGNNLFGIKSHGQAGGQTLATTEYVNGKPVRVNDSFRGYSSPADSVAGYADFLLQNPRYKPLMQAQGLDAQLQALGASGYATDPNYANSVGAIARSINLPGATDANEAMATGQPIPPAPAQVASLDPSAGMEQTAAAAPPLPAPQAIQDRPVAQVAQADVRDPATLSALAGGTAGQYQPGQVNMQAIIQALSSPYADDQTKKIAGMLLGQQMEQQQQANDPLRQLQIQKMQQDLSQGKLINAGNGFLYNPTTQEWITAPGANQQQLPAGIQELDWRAKQAGLQPGTKEYQDFMISGGKGPLVNVNTGTIPQGYQLITDPTTGAQRLEALPGGPADKSAQNAARDESRATSTDVITGAADKIRALSKSPASTGLLGAAASYIPSSDAAELYRQVDVLKSNATVENLNAMRAQSPTGGALGNVTEKENAMLANKAGALDPKSPHFQEQLDDYERTLLRIIHGKEAGDRIFEQTRKTTEGGTDEGWTDLGNGVRIRQKN